MSHTLTLPIHSNPQPQHNRTRNDSHQTVSLYTFFTVVFKLINQIHQFKFTPSEYQLTYKLDQNFIIIQTKTEKEIKFFRKKFYDDTVKLNSCSGTNSA